MGIGNWSLQQWGLPPCALVFSPIRGRSPKLGAGKSPTFDLRVASQALRKNICFDAGDFGQSFIYLTQGSGRSSSQGGQGET